MYSERAAYDSAVEHVVAMDDVDELAVADLLTRAFVDSPVTAALIREPADRARFTAALFERMVRHARLFGEIHCVGTPPIGAAVWFRIGAPGAPEPDPERSGLHELPRLFGPHVAPRMGEFVAFGSALHERCAHGEHWFLNFLGVDPAHQGGGVGSALMRAMFDRADADRLPYYLDTFQSRNVPLYERHGFEIVESGEVPGFGLPYWAMVRPPR